MALRNSAAKLLGGFGLRPQLLASMPSVEVAQSLKAVASRSYAKVMEGLKYAKSHEYIKPEGGDVVVVGISDHAQAELGDVVYVELPEVGRKLKKGETFGVVESVKAASDVYSPVSGEVLEVNGALVDKPATVNASPYADGWLIKMKMSKKDEMSSLLDAATYKKECN